MVFNTFIARRTAKLQTSSCYVDFCLSVELAAEAPCSMSGKTNHVGVTTMENLDQGSLHHFIKHPETDMSRPGFELPAGHATKELFRQLINLFILSRYTSLF
jgi:hypothetical protein